MIHPKRIFYVSLILIVSVFGGSARGADVKPKPIIMRVCLSENADTIDLYLRGPYKIHDVESGNLLKRGKSLRARITPVGQGIQFSSERLNSQAIRIRTSVNSNIYINDRRVRGELVIIISEKSKLTVINYLEMEEYLCGVLYHEVSHRWPMEVLKAQAVAARTFALYHRRENRLKDYDVRSDIFSQVYGGRESETWSTNRAVQSTRGEVLVYDGKLFPAYFHATCGGRTEDASLLWNIDLAPLKGVQCDFCVDSPHYHWTKRIPVPEIEKKLVEKGYKLTGISSIRVASRDPSGRAEKIELVDESGTVTMMTSKDLRLIMGTDVIRSTNFDIQIENQTAFFKGLGWGHGVGLCQWGANGMARQGRTKEEILKFYYPGSEIATISSIKDQL